MEFSGCQKSSLPSLQEFLWGGGSNYNLFVGVFTSHRTLLSSVNFLL